VFIECILPQPPAEPCSYLEKSTIITVGLMCGYWSMCAKNLVRYS
jgi:hypothetical protein